MKSRVWSGVALGLVWASLAFGVHAQGRYNGFDVSNASIDSDLILSGGPPRDGIPAIDDPQFTTPDEATYLRDDDPVMGFRLDGVARAYPLRVLVWHEIVNDTINDRPFVVTYCPLCGSSLVFDGAVNGERLSFGVSGLLFQSDVLMYDRGTESLWSQLKLECVSGPMVGTPLEWLPSEILTFGSWKARNAKFQQEVLARPEVNGRFLRDYSRNPYEGYLQNDAVWFGVPEHRLELPSKEWVVGVLVGSRAGAYPMRSLEATSGISDRLGDRNVRVSFDPMTQEVRVWDVDRDQPLPFTRSFWFAWQAFYPETRLRLPPPEVTPMGMRFFSLAPTSGDAVIESSLDLHRWNLEERVPEPEGLLNSVIPVPQEASSFFLRVVPDPGGP